MISRFYRAYQKLRWALDPGQWMLFLLGLSKQQGVPKKNGLILIQIDGLSYGHFHRALACGYLPFLKRLRENERYRDWIHYSGVPSCTPAIQGELFYGVKQCVPAFQFRDHKTREIFTFYDSHGAVTVEKRLQEKRTGLLLGGSSYSNIFAGGAGENAHFCIASIGWKSFFKALNPYSLSVLLLFNVFAFLRLVYYVFIEFAVAAFDFIRGTLLGYGFREEFQFILSRLIVSIGLREISTLGVKLDIARGLPIIHVNFFGYDDQAHRRGPSSGFAYWTLPGIDGCVKRIWKAAKNSLARDYDLWIYSDHGQEEVVPYPVETGKRIEKAVEEIFREMLPGEEFLTGEDKNEKKKIGCRSPGVKPLTVKATGRAPLQSSNSTQEQKYLSVTAQGPVGFIYPHRDLTGEEKERIAQALVAKAGIPLVMIHTDEGKVYGFTGGGKFLLPAERSKILGADHPYLEEVGPELESLCRHPDSGTFVLIGWRKGQKSISFPMEYGSHAGPGPHETEGFALLPRDIRVQPERNKKFLRPLVLREAALGFLQGNEKNFYGTDPVRPLRHALRLMTYNVHSCIGMDGRLSPERIARVIARHDPDVIALQELDAGRLRTQGIDQAKIIARLLDMYYHFHPVMMVEEEMFGNAILSRYPLRLVRAHALPRFSRNAYFEPRGALWVEVQYLDSPFHLINTHLSLWNPERKRQAEALCSGEWLGNTLCAENVILCGDLNAAPQSHACRTIQRKLEDVQLSVIGHTPLKTWFGHFPLGRIDHIFVSCGIGVIKVEVPSSRLEKIASDHLPLIAELKISFSKSVSRRSE